MAKAERIALPLPEPPTSAIETVFETLLADIVRGTYAPGSRLPAERELARMLGASRPTLREALRRLAEWNLVVARRGSGIAVRDYREWTIEVLPAYLRYSTPGPHKPTFARFVQDLLQLRRSLMLEVVRIVVGRLPAGGTDKARESVDKAWAARNNAEEFVTHDFMVMRHLVEAANFLPGVWMVNRMAGVYLDLARSLTSAITPPDDYEKVYSGWLDKLAKGEADAAIKLLDAYLERHDNRLVKLLEQFN
jgi:DNA-binding FadR family transcriptional regulator